MLNFRKIFNPKIYHNQCYNRSILGKNYNWTHQMFSIKIMLRYQLLPFKNCRHWADFIILEMLWWRFWKRQSGEFCIGCNWIPCFCIRYRNAAITEHGSLSRDAMFCSSRIVHPYRRNQPWFQVYTSVCPRGARREKWGCEIYLHINLNGIHEELLLFMSENKRLSVAFMWTQYSQSQYNIKPYFSHV